MDLSQLLQELMLHKITLYEEYEELIHDIDNYSPFLAKRERPRPGIPSEQEYTFALNHTIHMQLLHFINTLEDYLDILAHQLAEPHSKNLIIFKYVRDIRATHTSLLVLDANNTHLKDTLNRISAIIQTMATELTAPETSPTDNPMNRSSDI